MLQLSRGTNTSGFNNPYNYSGWMQGPNITQQQPATSFATPRTSPYNSSAYNSLANPFRPFTAWDYIHPHPTPWWRRNIDTRMTSGTSPGETGESDPGESDPGDQPDVSAAAPGISPYQPLGALTAPPPQWAGMESLGPGTQAANQNFQASNQANFYPLATGIYQRGREIDAANQFQRDLATSQSGNRYGQLNVQRMANQLQAINPYLNFMGNQMSLPLQMLRQAIF